MDNITSAQLKAFAFILGDLDAVEQIDSIDNAGEDASLQIYYTRPAQPGDEDDYVVAGSDADNGALWEIYKAGYMSSDKKTVSGDTYWTYGEGEWACDDSEYLEPIRHLMPHKDAALYS